MCTFIESVVAKLGALIPKDGAYSFKSVLLQCLEEGGPEGLRMIKEELNKLDEKPSEDIVNEIEEMYEDYTRDLTSKYKTDQAADIAKSVKGMYVNGIFMAESITGEVENKMQDETWKILSRLEACDSTPLPPDLAEQLLEYGDTICILSNSPKVRHIHSQFVKKINESTSPQTE